MKIDNSDAAVRKVDVAAFAMFRRANGLDFDRRHVPAVFENMIELEHEYAKAEGAAAEAKRAAPALPAPTPQLFVTEEKLDKTLKQLDEGLTEAFDVVVKRIAELEARPLGLDYRGVFEPGASYGKNMAVSHAGSTWVALHDHPGKPGVDNSWQLACKRGRDGKDGKDGKP